MQDCPRQEADMIRVCKPQQLDDLGPEITKSGYG